jgi:hypothetical protein
MDTRSSTRSNSRPGLPTARFAALTAAVALAILAAPAAPAWAGGQAAEPVGAVYVASNSWAGNEIITFPRLADGTLLPPLPGVPTGVSVRAPARSREWRLTRWGPMTRWRPTRRRCGFSR